MKITAFAFILSALLIWNCDTNNINPDTDIGDTNSSSIESSESSELSSSSFESSESSGSSSSTPEESSEENSSATESSSTESSEESSSEMESSSEPEPEDPPSSYDEPSSTIESSSEMQSSALSSSSSSIESSSVISSSAISSSSSVENPIATGTLTVEFSPKSYDGHYADKNCWAAFVIDENGTYIKTIEARSDDRLDEFEIWTNYLDGDEPDGITGATVKNHDRRYLSWDLKDRDNNHVTKGTYYLHMAFTEDNYSSKHPGVEHATQFVISGEASTVTDNSDNFEDIKIVHTP